MYTAENYTMNKPIRNFNASWSAWSIEPACLKQISQAYWLWGPKRHYMYAYQIGNHGANHKLYEVETSDEWYLMAKDDDLTLTRTTICIVLDSSHKAGA